MSTHAWLYDDQKQHWLFRVADKPDGDSITVIVRRTSDGLKRSINIPPWEYELRASYGLGINNHYDYGNTREETMQKAETLLREYAEKRLQLIKALSDKLNHAALEREMGVAA